MGHIVTFAQQKGGAGKTTIAAQLAAHWTGAGRRVALVDLDPQASLTRWARLRDDPDLTRVETRDYRAAGDLRTAARGHDLVLVDCPGAASSLLDNAIGASDLIVVPCQPSVMDVWATESILAAAARLRTPARIVFNRMPPRPGTLADVQEALGPAGEAVLTAALGNRVAFSRAMTAGRAAAEIARRSPAATEVAALAAEIEAVLAASEA